MEKKIKSFLDRNLVRWVLALSTIFSICWAIFEHYYTRNPRVEFEIISEARLFNNSEKVSSIRLFIDSLDVKKENLNVSLFSIKVVNNGRKHLSSSDYASKSFGIEISNGRLLDETQLIGASNGYIKEEFERFYSVSSDSLLLLPKVALDIDDWYELSIALLQENGVRPILKPVGKLLGQRNVLIHPASSKETLPFWRQVFYGSVWANIVRVLLGFILLFALAVILVVTLESTSSYSEKKKSKKLDKEIENSMSIPGFIKDDVKEGGLDSIVFAGERIKDEGIDINKEYRESLEFVSAKDNFANPSFEMHRRVVIGYQALLKKGYMIENSNGDISIPNQVKDAVSWIYEWMLENHLYAYAFKRNFPVVVDSESINISV